MEALSLNAAHPFRMFQGFVQHSTVLAAELKKAKARNAKLESVETITVR